jgi:hypothetical protein
VLDENTAWHYNGKRSVQKRAAAGEYCYKRVGRGGPGGSGTWQKVIQKVFKKDCFIPDCSEYFKGEMDPRQNWEKDALRASLAMHA